MTEPHYSISTPENVDLHLELAGLGSRIWAAFIDMALLYLLILVLVVVLILVAVGVETFPLPPETKKVAYFTVTGIGLLLLFALQFGYYIVFEKSWKGQTPGKRFAQIRVIEANGQPVNLSSVIIRNLVRLVDVGFMMLGVVLMILDKKERRLGDMLGGTLVIREKQPSLAPSNLRIKASAPATSFVDAGQIKPDDYHLLVDFLKRRHQMQLSSRSRLAKEMMDYFKMKLNPEDAGENPEEFLEKVYLSYSAESAKVSNSQAALE